MSQTSLDTMTSMEDKKKGGGGSPQGSVEVNLKARENHPRITSETK